VSRSKRVLFRAKANLGAALISAGRLADAANAFDEAASVEGDTADGNAYAARAAHVRSQPELCFERASRAIELDPNNALAAALLVDTAPEDVSTETLEARLGEVIYDVDVGSALSRRYGEKGDHEKAIRAARNISSAAPSWQRSVAIGSAILRSFEDKMEVRIGAPVEQEEADRIAEAVDCLESAWKEIGKRADRANWDHVCANLAAAYQFVGCDEDADQAILEALELQPAAKEIRTRAVPALLRRSENDRAVKIAVEIGESGLASDALFAAHVCISAQQFDLALKWAKQAFNASEGQDKARAADIELAALEGLSGPQVALSRAKELKARSSGPSCSTLDWRNSRGERVTPAH
jgi:tetratricopeptide (TPR) repeat protein